MKPNLFVSFFLFLSFLAGTTALADDFYRTFYNESLKSGPYARLKEWDGLNTSQLKARVAEAYGANIIFLPYENDRKPKASEITAIDSWFLMSSYDDEPWVRTRPGMDIQKNFMELEEKWVERLKVKYPKAESIADKYDEYQFLTHFYPEIAPPKMQLAADFKKGNETAAEKAAILAKVKGVMAAKQLSGAALEKQLVELELIRTRINKTLGFSVMKNREMNHSEGRLPKSKKEWVELYANYVASGEKAATDKIIENDGSVTHHLLELDYPEGFALETVLKNPDELVVQKMVDLQREVRMHIARGKLVKGASFLRFYKLNEYLPKEELEMMEKAVEEHLLAKVAPEDRDGFYASPDVYLTKTPVEDGYPSRRVLIGDFNDDICSGYLEPDEDAITTNLFALEFRGQNNPPPYLVQLDAFRSLPILHDQKLPALMAFLERSAPFMEGDVLQAYFDRIGESYHEWLARAADDKQRAKEYGVAIQHLLHFKEMGPRTLHLKTQKEKDEFYSNYQYSLLQFVAQFQDAYPHLRAPIATMETLRDHLKGMSTDVQVVLAGSEEAGPKSKIVATERAEEITKAELRAIRKELKQKLSRRARRLR